MPKEVENATFLQLQILSTLTALTQQSLRSTRFRPPSGLPSGDQNAQKAAETLAAALADVQKHKQDLADMTKSLSTGGPRSQSEQNTSGPRAQLEKEKLKKQILQGSGKDPGAIRQQMKKDLEDLKCGVQKAVDEIRKQTYRRGSPGAFESVDQKSEQLFNKLSQILKSLQEIRSQTIHNL